MNDEKQEYNAALAKIRSFLAGNRSRETLTQCQSLLESARSHATAMQGLAEVEGNPARVTESKQRIQRDIGPLSKEVKRQLDGMARQDLFNENAAGYEAPQMGGGGGQSDMQGLLSNSEDMLRESLALCADSEEIGTSTLLQMGRQREQLETTAGHIDATRNAVEQAGTILRSM